MLSLEFFLEVLARGIGLGIAYALMGLGLALVFGVMRITNFACGEFYMLGAFVIFYLITLFNIPAFLAIILGMIALFFIGVIIERLLLSPVAKDKVSNPMEYSMIITFALSILLKNVAVALFGSHYRNIPDYFTGFLHVGSVSIPYSIIFSSVVSIILIVAVMLFLNNTWTGRGLRALSQSRNGAKVMGVNIPVYNAMVFGISASLAAVAGGVLAPLTLVYPTVGGAPLIKGYVILAIGGLGSIGGSLVAGILLGVVESVGSVLLSSAYKDFYGFGLLILFLIFRPRGLFGQE